ncbi:MAG: (deoxy)nucleoside triphosphate pyrophosphohydrolase [Propionibacteriaceae bacterium]
MIEVVGVAVVRDGRVLAARRTHPVATAGRWEFPGGKVERSESATQAAVREVREELGCRISVTGWLAGSWPIGSTQVLRVAVAELIEGEPAPTEHDAIRWLAADQLDGLDWLAADRPFLAAVGELLGGAGHR